VIVTSVTIIHIGSILPSSPLPPFPPSPVKKRERERERERERRKKNVIITLKCLSAYTYARTVAAVMKFADVQFLSHA